MSDSAMHLAIDLGASSGRLLAGSISRGEFHLEEVHRFPNGPITVGKRLHWNLLGLWQEIETGLQLAAQRFGNRIQSVGADTWGVDFVLLDRNRDLLGPPSAIAIPELEAFSRRLGRSFREPTSSRRQACSSWSSIRCFNSFPCDWRTPRSWMPPNIF